MKKSIILSAFICLSLSSAFAKADTQTQRVIKTEPSEIREVLPIYKYYKDRKGEITYSEMKEDLNYFKFLMKDIYAGYDLAESKGMNLNLLVSEIEEKHSERETVFSRDIAKDIWANLQNYINDQHFTIFFDQWNSESENYQIYYTDLFLKDSEVEAFSKANPTLEILPYCSRGVVKNRVAKLSEKDITQIEVNGKPVKAKRYLVNPKAYSPKYKEKETPFTGYIHLESFLSDGSNGQNKTFQKFISAGQKFQNKENIVLDLRSNSGGDPKYIEAFIKSLIFNSDSDKKLTEKMDNSFEKELCKIKEGNFKKESYTFVKNFYDNLKGRINQEKADKIKPSAYEKTLLKEYGKRCKTYRKKPEINYLKTNFFDENLPCLENFPAKSDFAFKGHLIILLDRNSASASEETVLYATKILGEEKVTVAGENSWGCLEYATVYDYLLPNSKIGLHLGAEFFKPAMDKLLSWHGEGKGIFPDIWSSDEDMLDTLVYLTKDEGLREILKGMN